MVKDLFIKNAGSIWQNQLFGSNNVKQELNLELQNNIFSLLSAGEFYYYIFNLVDVKFDFISPEVTKVLGYSPDEITAEFCLEKIHPDDKNRFLNYENTVMNFFHRLPLEKYFNYKVRYDYRMMKKNGEYARLLQQVITINYSLEGGVCHTFGTHTDISHLKSSSYSPLSFIGLNGEESFINYPVENFEINDDDIIFSKREREILNFLWEGKESKEIAVLLNLSPDTVNTHRRNMLQKSNTKNSMELIRFALKEGLL